jgi:hypothetical protein
MQVCHEYFLQVSMCRPGSGAFLKDVFNQTVKTSVEGFEAEQVEIQRALSLPERRPVVFFLEKAVSTFFSMASLKSCSAHGWERRRKARIVLERRE